MAKVSTQILIPMLRVVYSHKRCHLYSSRAFDMSAKKGMPEYNYGLCGKGKSNKAKGKSRHHLPVHTEGEVLFGVHPVALALSSHFRSHFYTVYMDRKHRDNTRSSFALENIKELASRQQVPVQFVPKNTLTQLSGDRPHQGVCLDASPRLLPHCDMEELVQGTDFNPTILWLFLYNVKDPMNFGAILRSSYFLGVNRVIVPGVNSCALSPVVSKASAGALEVMDIHQIDGNYRSVQQLMKVWQSHGGQVVGTASQSDCSQTVCSLQNFTVSAPTLLIVGNEGSGIDEDVMDLCDTLLTILPPCQQQTLTGVTSLNVSVATVLYKLLRQHCCQAVGALALPLDYIGDMEKGDPLHGQQLISLIAPCPGLNPGKYTETVTLRTADPWSLVTDGCQLM